MKSKRFVFVSIAILCLLTAAYANWWFKFDLDVPGFGENSSAPMLFDGGYGYRLKLSIEGSHDESTIMCKLVRVSDNYVVFMNVVVDHANPYEFNVEDTGYYKLTGVDLVGANARVNVDKWVD